MRKKNQEITDTRIIEGISAKQSGGWDKHLTKTQPEDSDSRA